MDGSPPGSPVPGILQARTLEWVAISFSNAWKGKVKVKWFSCVRLLVTPWTAAYQAPPSMGFSRQECWSGVPSPSPSHIYKPWENISTQCARAESFQSCLTVAPQAPLSMGFSRQEYCSGLPCPPPGDLSDPEIKPASLTSPALAGGFFPTSATCVLSNCQRNGTIVVLRA